MNTEERSIPPELARRVREIMTPDEARHAYDDAYNVFAALEEEDADVLFVLAIRAREYGAVDLDSFIKGYEAGHNAGAAMRDADASSTASTIAQHA